MLIISNPVFPQNSNKQVGSTEKNFINIGETKRND
jgi:hypothetical protein